MLTSAMIVLIAVADVAALASPTVGSAAGFTGCQKVCEAAGHCSSTPNLVSCDQQPSCEMGCAVAALPGITVAACEAECITVRHYVCVGFGFGVACHAIRPHSTREILFL